MKTLANYFNQARAQQEIEDRTLRVAAAQLPAAMAAQSVAAATAGSGGVAAIGGRYQGDVWVEDEFRFGMSLEGPSGNGVKLSP